MELYTPDGQFKRKVVPGAPVGVELQAKHLLAHKFCLDIEISTSCQLIPREVVDVLYPIEVPWGYWKIKITKMQF